MPQNPLTNAPIPGQSLTRSPDQKGPWEMPPKFPNTMEAMDHLLGVVSNRKFMKNYARLVAKDKKLFVDRLASSMLQEGFINGMWTVDTMMLLIEPLIALLVWAAAQLDATVSFSNDTGFEDRSGFDYSDDAIMQTLNPENAIEQPPEEDVQDAQAELSEQQGTEAPVNPNVAAPSQGPSSPLVGGQ